MPETEQTTKDARALLWSTSIANAIVLVIKVGYMLCGAGGLLAYVVIMSAVTIANVLSLAFAKKSPRHAVLIFASVSYIGIVSMLAIDAVCKYNTFPTLANALPLICCGAAYVVGLKRAVPYIIAVVFALTGMMILYGPGDAVIPLGVATVLGVLVGRLRDELDRNRRRADVTEAAIDTYVKINNGG
jgi:hypothetical protein